MKLESQHRSATPLTAKIFQLLCEVPRGKVTTYGELARAANSKAFRAVGQILNRNTNAPKVPCHRVVMSDGGIGGYAFGLSKKIDLLKSEGVLVSDGRVVDFESRLFRFGR
jgi:methylated-DNA-[protein]-cysteine S-methyltransferase